MSNNIYKAREVVRHGIPEIGTGFAREMHERAISHLEELLRQIKAFRAVRGDNQGENSTSIRMRKRRRG